MGFAGFAGVVESGAFATAFGGEKEEALLGTGGKPDEACFALGIGSSLEVEFMKIHESIGDADSDIGGIDGLAGGVGSGEIGGAGAEAGIDDGDGFWVNRRGREGGQV